MSRLSQNIEKQNNNISTNDILNLTSQGLDIFTKELGNISQHKNISSIFRTDKNPSVKVKPSKTTGIWLYTDYTTGEVFTPFTFIAKLYNLEFKDVINKIAFDFGLKNNKCIVDYQKLNIIPTIKPKIIEKPILYEYQTCSFTKEAHKYWGVLKEGFLNENNVFMVCKLAFDKKVVDCPKNEEWYVYVPDGKQKGIKVLKIGKTVTKADKWRSYDIPNTFLWDYSFYKDKYINQLFVVKSRKDQLVLKKLGFDTISMQSENANILDENMKLIIPLAKEIVICTGSDNQGVDTCIKVQQKYNTRYYNTPKTVLFCANDIFSYVMNFSEASILNHLKSKGFIPNKIN